MKYVLISYFIAASVAVCNNKNHLPVNKDSVAITDTNSDNSAEPVKNETIAGKWFLQPALPSDTASGKIPALDFNLQTQKFSGNTGCNAMSGSFVLKADALSFNEDIISTKMACAGYNEKSFLESLLKTNRFQIKNGTLQLMYNTTILSNWKRTLDSVSTKQI